MWAPNVKPYIGVDLQARHLPMEDKYGDKHFQDDYLAPNLFIGTSLTDVFSIEGSRLKSNKKHKDPFYNPNEPVLGFDTTLSLNTIDQALYHVAKSQVDGWFLHLIGEYPVWENTTAFLGLGASFLKMHFSSRQFSSDPIQDETMPFPVEWNTNHKAVFRASLGLKHMFMKCFGMRAQVAWENTSKLSAKTLADPILPPPNIPAHYYEAKLKNSTFFSLGVFYQFPENLLA
tara:strand:- start:57175 stop:57867 length:693 start_codon:yes stop_codon:yes gene_type:complete